MIQHYLIIAWRNLTRNRFFTLINVLGFTIGIASALLLGLYSWHEINYDNFHEKKDRIFLIGMQGKDGDEEQEGGWTTPPMGPALYDYFAEVEAFTRLCLWFDEVMVTSNDKKIIETGLIGADSSIFNIFTIPFIKGNPSTALTQPNSIVISRSAAKKYFGEEDPMGKTLRFNHFFSECKVTGVVEDYPDNSHFDFEILLSLSSLKTIDFNFDHWHNHTFVTYVLLDDQVAPGQISSRFHQFLKDRYEPYLLKRFGKTYEEMYREGDYYRIFLEPLEQLHLGTLVFDNREGKKLQTYALGIIGLVILLLAGINYVNLSTAISVNRAKEIGIRKTVGSGRLSLVKQFITESILITMAGMLLGIFLFDLFMPYFSQVTGQDLKLDYTHPITILGLVGFALTAGALGGIYPALVISSFKPVNIFGHDKRTGGGKAIFRNVLVVLQFALCVIMIISTLLVYKQLNYMQSINLGFDTEQILVLKRSGLLNKNQEVFKQELLKRSDVTSVSFTNTIPGRHFDGHGQHFQGEPGDEFPTIYPLVADIDLLATLNLEVTQGKQFDPAHPDRKVALINEAAVSHLQLENPMSMVIDKGTMGSEPYTIIGVVRNFHFNSFHHQVEPLVIYPMNQLDHNRFNYILVKVNSEDIQNTVLEIEEKWNQLSNYNPFDYTFLDQDFERLFEREKTTAKVYAVFSFISIFIASLGLLGLISYFTFKRTKEIGIRKIVGASAAQIILLLSKDFSKWMFVSFLVGMPLAWYLMRSWIRDFQYQTNFSWWIFALAGGVTLAIALVTVSFQTIKAARANPVDALKNE